MSQLSLSSFLQHTQIATLAKTVAYCIHLIIIIIIKNIYRVQDRLGATNALCQQK